MKKQETDAEASARIMNECRHISAKVMNMIKASSMGTSEIFMGVSVVCSMLLTSTNQTIKENFSEKMASEFRDLFNETLNNMMKNREKLDD